MYIIFVIESFYLKKKSMILNSNIILNEKKNLEK